MLGSEIQGKFVNIHVYVIIYYVIYMNIILYTTLNMIFVTVSVKLLRQFSQCDHYF